MLCVTDEYFTQIVGPSVNETAKPNKKKNQ